MSNFYNKAADQQAYNLAQRLDKISVEEDRENEIRRLSPDLRDRVEYYLQLFYHKKQKA
jgi:hypothetical protein